MNNETVFVTPTQWILNVHVKIKTQINLSEIATILGLVKSTNLFSPNKKKCKWKLRNTRSSWLQNYFYGYEKWPIIFPITKSRTLSRRYTYNQTPLWMCKQHSAQCKWIITQHKLQKSPNSFSRARNWIFFDGHVSHLISTQQSMLFSNWRRNLRHREPQTSSN